MAKVRAKKFDSVRADADKGEDWNVVHSSLANEVKRHGVEGLRVLATRACPPRVDVSAISKRHFLAAQRPRSQYPETSAKYFQPRPFTCGIDRTPYIE